MVASDAGWRRSVALLSSMRLSGAVVEVGLEAVQEEVIPTCLANFVANQRRLKTFVGEGDARSVRRWLNLKAHLGAQPFGPDVRRQPIVQVIGANALMLNKTGFERDRAEGPR